MRAVIIEQYGEPSAVLSVREVEKPSPKPGEVVVKIAAATLNPADGAFVRGYYVRKTLPTVPGLEGAGTVVAHNAGAYGAWLMGKRVACTAPADGPGTWAEYMACRASACVPLMKRVSSEAAAALQVNPLTAISLLDRARKGGHSAVVQTAAGSALGRMIFRLAERRGVPIINIVRRADAAEKLRAEGRTHVLDSSAEGFEAALKALSGSLRATMAFDAVAGDTTALLLRAMPHGAKAVVYGGLSGKDPYLGIPDAIFHGKAIEGFWLPLKMKETGTVGALRMMLYIQRNMDIFGTEVLERLPLERAVEGLDLLATRGSDGKVLLVP